MTRYMHTLDGRPAAFYEQSGVCFAHKRIKLASSLAQIKREQRKSIADRKKRWLKDDVKYGYVTVYLPHGDKSP